jgi:hypothetical protein
MKNLSVMMFLLCAILFSCATSTAVYFYGEVLDALRPAVH